jgi:hypothetical protein
VSQVADQSDAPSRKLWTALHELNGYLTGQSNWLVNYAKRHRAGLRVGTALTEATANFLVNRRMNKSQQMRWTRRGADLLLQVRCAVYNGTLGSGFGQRFDPSVALTHKWHWQPDPQVLDSPDRPGVCRRPMVGGAFSTLCQSKAGRGLRGLGADALAKRIHCARARCLKGGESAAANNYDSAFLALAATPARIGPGALVP